MLPLLRIPSGPTRQAHPTHLMSVRKDFMYVFKPTRPGRAAAASGYALAPAPLRERAGRLARDTGVWLCRGDVRERKARIVRSRPPPASSPLRVPIRPAPPRNDSWVVIVTVPRRSRPEGPDGSGVNGLTPGPLRLLGRLSPAGQGPAVGDARLPLPSSRREVTQVMTTTSAVLTGQHAVHVAIASAAHHLAEQPIDDGCTRK
ncbi:MAG: hypothetical protein QOK27_295 [Gemmatimonadales bacterium]|nr:hypothetical protein [Gemmatimonadales bacterium]